MFKLPVKNANHRADSLALVMETFALFKMMVAPNATDCGKVAILGLIGNGTSFFQTDEMMDH